jgi:hypothetical protein
MSTTYPVHHYIGITLDFNNLQSENIDDITEKGGENPEKKTSCFGVFCLSLRVNLASKS